MNLTTYASSRSVRNKNGCWLWQHPNGKLRANSPGKNGERRPVYLNTDSGKLRHLKPDLLAQKYGLTCIPSKCVVHNTCGENMCCNTDHMVIGRLAVAVVPLNENEIASLK